MNDLCGPGGPAIYQIRIEGHLGFEWSDWFEGLTITLNESGETLLTRPVPDQSALYGLLKKMRDMGMTLLSVNRIEAGQAEAQEDQETDERQGKK